MESKPATTYRVFITYVKVEVTTGIAQILEMKKRSRDIAVKGKLYANIPHKYGHHYLQENMIRLNLAILKK